MPEADVDLRALTAAFGKRLRKIRHSQGLSQEKLAHLAGLHFTVVARLERGEREPRLGTIIRVAEGLGVQPGELLDRLRE